MLLRGHHHHINFYRVIDVIHLLEHEGVLVRVAPYPSSMTWYLILMPHLLYSFLYHDECELILSHRRPLRIDGLHETAKPNKWLHPPRIILILYYVLQIHYLIPPDSSLTIRFISFCNHLVPPATLPQDQVCHKRAGTTDEHRY